MRSCLLSVILVVLVAANGYCIWQIHQLRALVNEIHADMLRERARDRVSMLDHARSAIDAVARGDVDSAQAELKRLSELIEETRTMAQQQRERLQQRLGEAKEAIDRGSARAGDALEGLVRELSQPEEKDDEAERDQGSEEP
jgi:hypothetical protein